MMLSIIPPVFPILKHPGLIPPTVAGPDMKNNWLNLHQRKTHLGVNRCKILISLTYNGNFLFPSNSQKPSSHIFWYSFGNDRDRSNVFAF